MENTSAPNFSPTYYWDYFQYVLRYVDKHYKYLLNPLESEFVESFQSLSFAAQCMYLRLSGRSVTWFKRSSLVYSEIESVEVALDELINQGFVGIYTDSSLNPAFLQVLTKSHCVEFLESISSASKSIKSLSKQALVDMLVGAPLPKMFDPNLWIRPLKLDLYHFCSFLFFGSKNRDLKEFVVRDLGHRQYMEIAEEDFQPYFTTRKEIDDKWKISIWRDWFYTEQDRVDPEQLKESLFDTIIPMASELSELAVPAYERLLFQVGRFLERQNHLVDALEVFELAGSAQALERRIRILTKLKRMDEALRWAEFGQAHVENPTELHFFQDYLARHASKKQVKQVTSRLKKADKIIIDGSYNGRVEQGVIDYYEAQGYYATFCENGVWKNILGLLTWELIFTDHSSGFHHPFQYAPTIDFTQVNPTRFSELLDMLHDRPSVLVHMQTVAEQHQGIINPLVEWGFLNWELIEKVLMHVETPALQQVLTCMWSRLSTHAKGFPDLFIQRENEFYFVEVKSPNDHLSAIQHFWHVTFAELGIPFQLIRVAWK